MSLTEPDDRISFSSGTWLPHRELRVSVDDLGFRQGVIAVERLRTYGGKAFLADAHLRRFQNTTGFLSIIGLPDDDRLLVLLDQLLAKNANFLARQRDVGVTLLATPGDVNKNDATLGLHLNSIDHQRVSSLCVSGQPIVVTQIHQPSETCWPRSLKVRSRIHYYLADNVARQSAPDAIGVLLDDDGSVTETSISNLAIVESRKIFSPRRERVLGGITQSLVEQLASEASIPWETENIAPDRLRRADEILLMGTDGGLWFASHVDGKAIGGGKIGNICSELRGRFDEYIRVD